MRYLIKNLNQFFLRNNNLKLFSDELNNFHNSYLNQFINLRDIDKRRTMIYSNSKYEILLLKWYPYYESTIHDHPDNGCLFKLLQGELIEKRYDKSLNLIDTNNLNKNSINYIDNNLFYHKIINNSDFISYSLHIYSPPNYQMKNFSPKKLS